MFSDEEKNEVLRKLEEIEGWQQKQDSRLEDIEEILRGDPDDPDDPGMRKKVGEMYQILIGWRAIRKFVLGVIFLVGAVFGSTVWDILTRVLGGGTP